MVLIQRCEVIALTLIMGCHSPFQNFSVALVHFHNVVMLKFLEFIPASNLFTTASRIIRAINSVFSNPPLIEIMYPDKKVLRRASYEYAVVRSDLSMVPTTGMVMLGFFLLHI